MMADQATEHQRVLIFDVATLFVFSVVMRLPFMYATVDDAFITFRYARNLGAGLGFVYNVGEPVLGTTTPLYTLWITLAGLSGFDLVVVGKLLNIVADAASAVLLYVLMRRLGSHALAGAVAILFATSPYNIFYAATGMETGLYTFLVLLTLFLGAQNDLAHRRWLALGCAGGLLVLTRPDGWLAVAMVAIVGMIRGGSRTDLLKALSVSVACQAAWTIFALGYFGSPIPNSVSAKALSYQVSGALDWGLDFFRVFFIRSGLLGGVIVISLFLVGLIAALMNRTRALLLIFAGWFALYLIAFTLARGGPYGWYYAPLMPIFFLFVCLGVYEGYNRVCAIPTMARAFQTISPRVWQIAALILVCLLVIVSFLGVSVDAQVESAFEREIGQPLGVWLRDNTPASATVALESIGAVGWYSERHIIDEGGLVSKRVVALNRSTPGDINILGILQAFTPDYYVAWKTWELEKLEADPVARSWLSNNYEEMRRYDDGIRTWILFQRREVIVR